MTEGLRDAFVENDVIGNYATGTNILGGFSSRKRRKKASKSRKKTRHRKHRKHRKQKRHRRNKGSTRTRGGIKYTKNGQPYKILANGRARFIKGRRK